jgi:RES domain-containing protein
MMAWRLCRRPYADLTGDGARLYGGRWNSPGRPVVYLADHPALAALEVRVHLDLPFELVPADFVLMQVEVPAAVVSDGDAPANTIAWGNAWLTEAETATVRVPSVLIPYAWNVLLNPRHLDATKAKILGIQPFQFDPRLWRPLAGEG